FVIAPRPLRTPTRNHRSTAIAGRSLAASTGGRHPVGSPTAKSGRRRGGSVGSVETSITGAGDDPDEMSTNVAVIGASMTQFGQREAWIQGLLAEAGAACLDDAGVAPDAVEHLYVSNMASGEFEGQTGVPNALAHDLDCLPAYTQRVDQTSSSGGA